MKTWIAATPLRAPMTAAARAPATARPRVDRYGAPLFFPNSEEWRRMHPR
jgi:hypothetical protein